MAGFAASPVAPPAPHRDGGTRKDLEDLILPFFSTFSFPNTPLFGEQGKVAQSFAHKARNCKVLHTFAKPARVFFQECQPVHLPYLNTEMQKLLTAENVLVCMAEK